ncbi:MAG: cytochrome C oxidase subunit IV family protein [Gemmatimonadetes bacterium]|nr:cytochrome C oxidase subunit IV family protein [Gemmatimonadota bacterium]
MEPDIPYRTYWAAWLILLALTVAMILAEAAGFPRALAVAVLVAAMLIKATVIGGWFMHLRFERLALVACVAAATLATAAFLFFLIAPDGVWMLRLSAG